MNPPNVNSRQPGHRSVLLWLIILGPCCVISTFFPGGLENNFTRLAVLVALFLLVQFSVVVSNLYLLVVCLAGFVAVTYTPLSAIFKLISENDSPWQMGIFIVASLGLVLMACWIMFMFYSEHAQDIREGK
jgi:hypothetical protein